MCDFFLWGYVKENVSVPQFPKNLEELKIRIKNAVNAVTPDIISNLSSMPPSYIYAQSTAIIGPNLSIYQLDNLKWTWISNLTINALAINMR